MKRQTGEGKTLNCNLRFSMRNCYSRDRGSRGSHLFFRAVGKNQRETFLRKFIFYLKLFVVLGLIITAPNGQNTWTVVIREPELFQRSLFRQYFFHFTMFSLFLQKHRALYRNSFI